MRARFIENIEEHCTFCLLTHEQELERETPLHIFYSCPTVENIYNRLYNTLLPGTMVSRRLIFCPIDDKNTSRGKFLTTISILTRKFFWDSKNRNTLPFYDDLLYFLKSEIGIYYRTSNIFKSIFNNCNISRQFRDSIQRDFL